MVKRCYKCKEVKPLTDFYKNVSQSKGYSSSCKTCKKAYVKEWKEKNRDKHLAQRARYRLKNKDSINLYNTEYNKIPQTKSRRNKWWREKRENDPVFYMRSRMSRVIQRAFDDNGYSKTTQTRKILGCDYKYLKKYIEDKFLDGMNWDNKGDWHIDHIIPLASANSVEEVIMLNHFRNLQPLWADDNVSKSAKYTPKDKEEYLKWYKENISKESLFARKK